jgi:hypothetical protein
MFQVNPLRMIEVVEISNGSIQKAKVFDVAIMQLQNAAS